MYTIQLTFRDQESVQFMDYSTSQSLDEDQASFTQTGELTGQLDFVDLEEAEAQLEPLQGSIDSPEDWDDLGLTSVTTSW